MELTKEIWTQSDYDEFAEYLKTLADEKYKKFSDRLFPAERNLSVFVYPSCVKRLKLFQKVTTRHSLIAKTTHTVKKL